jgi:hypothetical protein
MKKIGLLVLVVVLVLASTTTVWAGDPDFTEGVKNDAHKIRNKWSLSGTFVAHPGYNWGGFAEGATWTYKINIKEAMDGDFSVGSIHFTAGEIDVVGHIEATKSDYAYWSGENIAAVGWAEYDGITYYFMFLYAERATWLALSTTPYNSYWDTGTVWPGGLRAYQLHSKVPDETFTLDYKVIHGGS